MHVCIYQTERHGLEPATYWLQIRHPNHYVTAPYGEVGCRQLYDEAKLLEVDDIFTSQ